MSAASPLAACLSSLPAVHLSSPPAVANPSLPATPQSSSPAATKSSSPTAAYSTLPVDPQSSLPTVHLSSPPAVAIPSLPEDRLPWPPELQAPPGPPELRSPLILPGGLPHVCPEGPPECPLPSPLDVRRHGDTPSGRGEYCQTCVLSCLVVFCLVLPLTLFFPHVCPYLVWFLFLSLLFHYQLIMSHLCLFNYLVWYVFINPVFP